MQEIITVTDNTRCRWSSLALTAVSALLTGTALGQDPQHLWRFSARAVQGRTVHAVRGGLTVTAEKALEVAGSTAVFDGVNSLTAVGVASAQLPAQDITVSAWVSVSAPTRWGCIIGYIQDNGNYEKGWDLGYHNDRFVFQISTGPKLVTATAPTAFEDNTWYHVAGTYDGQTVRLYVDGQPVADAAGAAGPIAYPPHAFYSIGAYHDDNEYFRMQGRLYEAAVYPRRLSAEEIARHAAERPAATIPPPVLPARLWLQFTAPDQAVLHWDTSQPGPGRAFLGTSPDSMRVLESGSSEHQHSVVLTDLAPDTLYTYSVGRVGAEDVVRSVRAEFDTSFNYTLPAVPAVPEFEADVQCAGIAEQTLAQTGVRRGICVVYGVRDGALAYHLARRSRLVLWLVDSDPMRIATLRRQLNRTGLYGVRFSAMTVRSLDRTALSDALANLVVSERTLEGDAWPGRPDEIRRVLAPGGHAVLVGATGATPGRDIWLESTAGSGWTVADTRSGVSARLKRRAFPGSGAWTHQYGTAANTATSGDELGQAAATQDLQLQWLGRPGPDFGIDRNPRMPAPLAVGGRLFHQGMNRVIALDAFNGTFLWSLEIPLLRRVNIPRDAGNWCADADALYVAVGNQAWQLDTASGRRIGVLELPEQHRDGHMWGAIAHVDGRLFGSSVKTGSSYTAYWGGQNWYDATKASATAKVCSDALFAYDPGPGRLAWVRAGGTAINTTIALGGGRLYVVESRNSALASQRTGRVNDPGLWQDQFLLALDAATGKLVWERPIDTVDGSVVFYLVYHPRALVLVSSGGKYHLYAFDPAQGQPLWEQQHDWPGRDHSAHMMHPVVIEDTLYLEPNGYRVVDGVKVTAKMGRRSGCHTYLGSRHALIYRGADRKVAMWDRVKETVTTWDRLRPSCWLSMVPAGGMLLAPEGGGGCSCAKWLETSVGFLPKAHRLSDGRTFTERGN